jgi:hypothetical protein
MPIASCGDQRGSPASLRGRPAAAAATRDPVTKELLED